MTGRRRVVASMCCLGMGLAGLLVLPARAQGSLDDYLTWTKAEATRIGTEMRKADSVGNRFSVRGLKTDRAVNYKLRVTWLTPEVIRATARLLQVSERLTADETRALVAEADAAGDTVFFVEMDPNEGSGIIPSNWTATLQPRGAEPGAESAIRGVIVPKLRDVRALAGVFKRDYAYDAFWVVFPLKTRSGAPAIGTDVDDIEFVANVQGREGAVWWPVPESVRAKMTKP